MNGDPVTSKRRRWTRYVFVDKLCVLWGCDMCDEAWNTLDDVLEPLRSHYRSFGKIWQFGEKQEND